MKRKITRTMITMSMAIISTVALSQKYDVKSEVVTKDKAPYAHITGSDTYGKPLDLQVTALSGTPLFTIKTWKYPSNPLYRNLSGLKIDFLQSGNSMIRSFEPGYPPVNKKQVIRFLLNEWKEDLIVNNSVNPEVEVNFIKQFNDDAAIQRALAYEKKAPEYIQANFPVKRDNQKSISLNIIENIKTSSGSVIRVTEVTQDKMYICTIKAELTSDALYTFYRKMDEPFVLGDEKIHEVTVATALVPAEVFYSTYLGPENNTKIFTIVDGKQLEIRLSIPNQGEKDLILFLIGNKYL